jgi:fibronectin-binding autotransporter adhesin
MKRKFHSLLPVFAGFIISVRSASGSDLYWDASNITVNGQSGGGAGTWNVGTGGWEDGISAVNWANNDNAFFGGTAGTITLEGGISAGTVTIQSS